MYSVLLYIFFHVIITADKKGGTMHIVTEMNIYIPLPEGNTYHEG